MKGTRPTLELFVRSLAPTARSGELETVLDRLDALVERGVVDDYSVTVWGEEVRADGDAVERTAIGRHVLDSLASFRAWAADNDASVSRFYETRPVERGLLGEEYTVTTLPVVAMAEYGDGDLQYVTPHEMEGTVRTVRDRLDVLAERDVARTEERTAAPVA